MDQEFKKQWIAALKSGEYIHRRGALRVGSSDELEVGYCCLGVLCMLKGATISDDGFWASYKKEEDDLLPPSLSEEIGLGAHDQNELAILNDAIGGDAFPQSVIDYIEAL